MPYVVFYETTKHHIRLWLVGKPAPLPVLTLNETDAILRQLSEKASVPHTLTWSTVGSGAICMEEF